MPKCAPLLLAECFTFTLLREVHSHECTNKPGCKPDGCNEFGGCDACQDDGYGGWKAGPETDKSEYRCVPECFGGDTKKCLRCDVPRTCAECPKGSKLSSNPSGRFPCEEIEVHAAECKIDGKPIAGCKLCNAAGTGCFQCDEGWRRDPADDRKCVAPCTDVCEVCDGPEVCTKCPEGMIVDKTPGTKFPCVKRSSFDNNGDLREAVLKCCTPTQVHREQTMTCNDMQSFDPRTEINANKATLKPYSPIETWDVSKVTNMTEVLKEIRANPDISSWDVSGVKDFTSMFANAYNFNQTITAWNVTEARNMGNMFLGASTFDQDLGQWKVDQVTNMAGMFWGGSVTSFQGKGLEKWIVDSVVTAGGMFHEATKFTNQEGVCDYWKKSVTEQLKKPDGSGPMCTYPAAAATEKKRAADAQKPEKPVSPTEIQPAADDKKPAAAPKKKIDEQKAQCARDHGRIMDIKNCRQYKEDETYGTDCEACQFCDEGFTLNTNNECKP